MIITSPYYLAVRTRGDFLPRWDMLNNLSRGLGSIQHSIGLSVGNCLKRLPRGGGGWPALLAC